VAKNDARKKVPLTWKGQNDATRGGQEEAPGNGKGSHIKKGDVYARTLKTQNCQSGNAYPKRRMKKN